MKPRDMLSILGDFRLMSGPLRGKRLAQLPTHTLLAIKEDGRYDRNDQWSAGQWAARQVRQQARRR